VNYRRNLLQKLFRVTPNLSLNTFEPSNDTSKKARILAGGPDSLYCFCTDECRPFRCNPVGAARTFYLLIYIRDNIIPLLQFIHMGLFVL